MIMRGDTIFRGAIFLNFNLYIIKTNLCVLFRPVLIIEGAQTDRVNIGTTLNFKFII